MVTWSTWSLLPFAFHVNVMLHLSNALLNRVEVLLPPSFAQRWQLKGQCFLLNSKSERHCSSVFPSQSALGSSSHSISSTKRGSMRMVINQDVYLNIQNISRERCLM